jgi:hypothetical protein
MDTGASFKPSIAGPSVAPAATRIPVPMRILASRVRELMLRLGATAGASWAYVRRTSGPHLVHATKWPPAVHYAVRALVVLIALALSAAASLRGVQDRALAAPAEMEVAAAGPTPVVTGVSLKTITANPLPQILPIAGNGFDRNTTVRLVSPMEEVITTFPSAALEAVTPTSFRLMTTLEDVGTYTLTVRNGQGPLSEPVTFTVKRPAPTKGRRD